MDIMNTYLGSVVQQKLSSITSTKDLLDEVERALQDLMDNYVLVDQELVANRHGMQLTPQVQRWHDKVQLHERQDIVNQLKVAYNNRGCLLGSCSLNLWANYKISQSSIKLYKEINNLKMEHDAFKEITETQPPRVVLEIATSVTLVGNTIKLNLEKVCGYLVDDNVSMVGIWGMGGVGKTTLLNEINNSLLGGDTNLGFNYVISLVVSKEPQFEKLQNEVSKRLGLPSYSGKNDIFEFLKKKNFLLLLDDIWKRVDLPEDLGIPLPLRQSQNSENGGQSYKRKVIFTTRDDEVCAHMNAHKKIKVECMDKEAWHLFKLFANEEIINSNENIKVLAMKVMEKCSGLPLALKVIGRATSNMKTPEEWRHMLRSLIKMDVRIVTGIEESLFHNLKVSYDNLASDTLRQCFLCCAQLCAGARIKVPDLIEHWIGCGLISDFGNMGEAFDEGYSLIAKLNEACLLEFYDINEYYVKLHDVIRGMALWIVSDCGKKKNKWIVCGSDDDLRQFSKWEAGNWEETELVSSKGTNFKKTVQKFLSDQNVDEKGQVSIAATSPRYPNLQSLFMNYYAIRDPSFEVVINFFPHMPSLTYLNLSNAPIASLPKEIQVLVNLQYLNISGTSIRSLPPEIEELKQLKYFFFRSPYFASEGELVRIKADGLSALSRLPELQVLDLYEHTCLEAGDLRILIYRNRIKGINMLVESVEILRLLKHLPTWKIHLKNIHDMPTLQLCDLSYKRDGEGLMELRISDCGFEDLLINGSGVSLKRLQLNGLAKLKQITWPVEAFRRGCFPKLTNVYIFKCTSLRSLSWVLHLPCLSTLLVQDCSAMKELIDPADQMQQASSGLPTFPNLRRLFLYRMPNLVSLSTCSLDFPVLFVLNLESCPKLKKLSFKPSIVNNKFEQVIVDQALWGSLEWEDTTIRSHLTKFHTAR
ncbi:probable disease resistance protein At1g61300 [Dioscorea cayenensis subsp. rotundata]|uniref:Probable disease resistance protein At1g61300 n=1 Tax=Dioscorea cayennensis subsp. rotundata TaxID=55577 RepID=A0AB40APA2_DIOCR|nr:probable disease resistance protein At1g61300 [Dioscorea cayenensis subsp. rotundata]XP_039116607.1 probable disease resistance protein At1g61300 [Dioscorea cayenensis subsp. rotundata]XP_039116608.1 probable disease resistance protein At1g61300 [Dioscorea cayenensis subsp. rotundata]